MQNNPPPTNEPGNARLSEEPEQHDLTLSSLSRPIIPSDDSTEARESTASPEITPAPAQAAPQVESAAHAPAPAPFVPAPQAAPAAHAPAAAPFVPAPQAAPAAHAPAAAPFVPAPQAAPAAHAPAAAPQPAALQGGSLPQGYVIPPGHTVSQGYLVPQGYTVSQGYLVPEGYVVYNGYVVPQSYVQQANAAISSTYVPATPPAAPQAPVPTTPQPGYVPQPGYTPQYSAQPSQPGFAPQYGAQPSGYLPPLSPMPPASRPRLPRERSTLMMLGGIALVVLVLLGVIFSAIARQGSGSSAPSSTTGAVPTMSTSPTSAVGQTTSAFQPANCPFEADANLLQEKRLSCGYVTVPENRSSKNTGKVRLAVAIFKADQYINTPDPDPVIRLDGGPGGPSLSGWAQYFTSGNIRDFVFNHDVVMFDQRGTGYSTPSLDCPELNSYQDASQGGGVSYEEAAHACYNRLLASGIDLNGFNTLQNAADVADIIHALGYRQMTLYGVSYGTRLALTVMRLYPSVVHATVLDSVYPPNHNRNDLASDAQRVFNVLFQGCAKDSYCNSKYPNLQSVFYTLVDQLNAHPISFYTVDANTNKQHTVTMAGDDLIGFVFSVLYATPLIPALPQIIYQIKNQQYSQLAQIYGQVIYDDTLSDGFFYSAECSEDGPYTTPNSIIQSEQGIEPHLATVFAKEDEQQEYDVCQFWKVNPLPTSQKQPVTSNIPTLIVTGEYDPITPPANGQEAAKTLSHSYFFEFPGQGHGQLYSSPCSDLIISGFEDNPSVQPDGSCIAQMGEPQFV